MSDAKDRKERPLYSGVLKYFPDALLEVAHCSFVGNAQHNPGEPLHWAKEKSTDEPDALARHLLDAGTRDTDGVRHSTKVAWRALAMLQREIEAERHPGDGIPGAPALLTPAAETPHTGTAPAKTSFMCDVMAKDGRMCRLSMNHAGRHTWESF